MSACRRCGWRIAGTRGYCVVCNDIVGDGALVVQRLPKGLDGVRRAEPIPAPDREVIVDGTVFEVVFDGRQYLLSRESR